MNSRSLSKQGKKNPAWKGNDVGYSALHDWIRERKTKPKWCEECGEKPPYDLANISGEYRRDINDFEYLCQRCHMEKDGRIGGLIASGKSRKLPNKICPTCQKEFHRDRRQAKFCSHECYILLKISVPSLSNINTNPKII